VPQLCVAFGAHTPWPEQVDHAENVPVELSHVRVCVPQLPQLREVAPSQLLPPQLPQAQLLVQVWVPFAPQACVVFALQAP